MDLCTIAAYGMGWVGAWNLLDMASYILQVCVCVCVSGVGPVHNSLWAVVIVRSGKGRDTLVLARVASTAELD
jgi:hypothetical protein